MMTRFCTADALDSARNEDKSVAENWKKDVVAVMSDTSEQDAATLPSATPDRHSQCDADLLDRMTIAALDGIDRAACYAVVKSALATGITANDIADHYIPALARDMGELWCSDQLSFAEVTIGVARLQSILRDLGPDWAGDRFAQSGAATILLVVAEGEFHTLGAMVMAGQLRRKGFSVSLSLGLHTADIEKKFRQTSFDAVFVSASRGEKLEKLRKIVEALRNALACVTPIVIGGTLLEIETDIAVLTGADVVTNDPDEALKLCGLTISPEKRKTRAART